MVYNQFENVAYSIQKRGRYMDKKEKVLLIKTARKNKDLKQWEIAEMVGINRSYYAGIEGLSKTPSLRVATSIADILDIEVKFFLK